MLCCSGCEILSHTNYFSFTHKRKGKGKKRKGKNQLWWFSFTFSLQKKLRIKCLYKRKKRKNNKKAIALLSWSCLYKRGLLACFMVTMMGLKLVMWNVVVVVLLGLCVGIAKASVSYDSKAITINGQRRILISGSIHYPRSTPEVFCSKCAFWVSSIFWFFSVSLVFCCFSLTGYL